MKCDGTCLLFKPNGVPDGRRYPLQRKCCALSLLALWEAESARAGLLAIMARQIGLAYSREVASDYERTKGVGYGPTDAVCRRTRTAFLEAIAAQGT